MARVIFDFDGTLADSLSVALEVANSMKFTRPLTMDDYYALRNVPTREILKQLNIPVWKVPKLVTRGRKLLKKQADQINPHPGIAAVLPQLIADGHELYVVSSNSPELVRSFLRRHKLADHFNLVVGNIGIFGKAAALKRLRATFLLTEDVYYVGDETRDIDAAKKVGMRMIAVSWGYNGIEALGAHEPDYLVRRPSEIRKVVRK